MTRKIIPMLLILSALALLCDVQPTLGQDQTGSIRGTVYRDVNENGNCSNEGEVRLGDIPIELVNDDSQEGAREITAPDGTFVYTNATLGLWRVTVVPGTGWRVTSNQTIEVVLTQDQPDAAGIDFCLVEIESQGGGQTLPESGAFIAPPLLIGAVAGLLLMVLGAGLIWLGNRQHSSSGDSS